MTEPPNHQIESIEAVLEGRYGRKRWHCHRPPVDELILTILSQHTSDLNSERAFADLTARYSSWEAVIVAAPVELANAIRSGGLANQKTPRIQAVLRSIAHERGSFDLNFLSGLAVQDAREWLTRLPGVGPKTASCVLLFSLGMPAIPVDTHVQRVSLRLGLVDKTSTPELTQCTLEARLGDNRERIYALHMNLIAHGRQVCIARRPRCGECPLTRCCDYYANVSTNA